jgi:anti-sigma factor ChrR (cupin superfamily)
LKDFLFYTCKKATELIEKSKVVPLGQLEKSRRAIHVSMCDACRTYQKSSDILDRKLTEHLQIEQESQEEIEEKKVALLEKLKLK